MMNTKKEALSLMELFGLEVPQTIFGEQTLPVVKEGSQVWAVQVPSFIETAYNPISSGVGKPLNGVRPLTWSYEFGFAEIVRRNEKVLIEKLVGKSDASRTILAIFPSFSDFIAKFLNTIIEEGCQGKLDGKQIVVIACNTFGLAPILAVLANKYNFEYVLPLDIKQAGYVLDSDAEPDLVGSFEFDSDDVPIEMHLGIVPMSKSSGSDFSAWINSLTLSLSKQIGLDDIPMQTKKNEWEQGAERLSTFLFCYGGTVEFAKAYSSFLKSLRRIPNNQIHVSCNEILLFPTPLKHTKACTERFLLWGRDKVVEPRNGESFTNFLLRSVALDKRLRQCVRNLMDADGIGGNTSVVFQDIPYMGDTGTHGCFYSPHKLEVEDGQHPILPSFLSLPLAGRKKIYEWHNPKKGNLVIHVAKRTLAKHTVNEVHLSPRTARPMNWD